MVATYKWTHVFELKLFGAIVERDSKTQPEFEGFWMDISETLSHVLSRVKSMRVCRRISRCILELAVNLESSHLARCFEEVTSLGKTHKVVYSSTPIDNLVQALYKLVACLS